MGYAHGIKWSDSLIKEKVLEVKNGLHLDRMPSRKECETYFQNHALTNAVSKRIGWYKLAEELGLEIKKSETSIGKAYEHDAMEILQGKGFEVERMPQNFPYDLLVNGCVKIDIKSSHLYKGKKGVFYTFNIEKPFATCDVYLLIALNEDDSIGRIMVVPSKFVVTNTQISVGFTNSKYHAFSDRWDYISDMSEFWKQVVI